MNETDGILMLERRPTTAVPAWQGSQGDVRARDDVLVWSSSGLLMVRHAPDGTSAPGMLVGSGAHVYDSTGLVGVLTRVLVDPDTDEIRALGVETGEPGTREMRVPVSLVGVAGADRVLLTAFEQYRPDERLGPKGQPASRPMPER